MQDFTLTIRLIANLPRLPLPQPVYETCRLPPDGTEYAADETPPTATESPPPPPPPPAPPQPAHGTPANRTCPSPPPQREGGSPGLLEMRMGAMEEAGQELDRREVEEDGRDGGKGRDWCLSGVPCSLAH